MKSDTVKTRLPCQDPEVLLFGVFKNTLPVCLVKENSLEVTKLLHSLYYLDSRVVHSLTFELLER